MLGLMDRTSSQLSPLTSSSVPESENKRKLEVDGQDESCSKAMRLSEHQYSMMIMDDPPMDAIFDPRDDVSQGEPPSGGMEQIGHANGEEDASSSDDDSSDDNEEDDDESSTPNTTPSTSPRAKPWAPPGQAPMSSYAYFREQAGLQVLSTKRKSYYVPTGRPRGRPKMGPGHLAKPMNAVKRSPGRPRIHPPKDPSLKRPPGRPRTRPLKDPNAPKRKPGRPLGGGVPRKMKLVTPRNTSSQRFQLRVVLREPSKRKSPEAKEISSPSSNVQTEFMSQLSGMDEINIPSLATAGTSNYSPSKQKSHDPNTPKRPRGRPRIHPPKDPNTPKRPRGRPKGSVSAKRTPRTLNTGEIEKLRERLGLTPSSSSATLSSQNVCPTVEERDHAGNDSVLSESVNESGQWETEAELTMDTTQTSASEAESETNDMEQEKVTYNASEHRIKILGTTSLTTNGTQASSSEDSDIATNGYSDREEEKFEGNREEEELEGSEGKKEEQDSDSSHCDQDDYQIQLVQKDDYIMY